jgi:hypothetical protein
MKPYPVTARPSVHNFPVLATPEQREQERLRQLKAMGVQPAEVPAAFLDELRQYFRDKKNAARKHTKGH